MNIIQAIFNIIRVMELDLNSVWENILKDIKGTINTPTYKTWFENINPVSLKKNCLTLSVGSSFAKEWLESRYMNILTSSAEKALNESCKIR
ncbi:MAG: hypothetical protein H5T85_01075, partial [Actinobacteria bacterium]|nr:hypothetical protein [Actinomycetota bacterium]